jgi:CRP-like cAMP-binding protein
MTDKNLMERLPFFKKVLLFHNLTEAQIKKLIPIMKISEVKENELICFEGARESTLFILLKGQVEISKRLLLPFVQSPYLHQEKSLITLSEKQHAFFGEMALFEDEPERSASIKALKNCTLAVIEKQDIIDILDKNPTIGSTIYKNISTELTRRLVKANRDILKLTTAFSLALKGD